MDEVIVIGFGLGWCGIGLGVTASSRQVENRVKSRGQAVAGNRM